MKRAFMILSLSGLMLAGSGTARGQEQPKPKKDTVNMDTDAKPKFYYAVEDEKATKSVHKSGAGTTIAIVCGGVVVAAGLGFYLLKKKKQ
jgi:hypothetical protein